VFLIYEQKYCNASLLNKLYEDFVLAKLGAAVVCEQACSKIQFANIVGTCCCFVPTLIANIFVLKLKI